MRLKLRVSDKSLWPLGLMCVISTVALGISAKAVVAPVLICLMLLSFLFFGGPVMPKPRMFLALLLMVPFALWLREEGRTGLEQNYYVPVGFLFIVGLYMLALATHHVMAAEKGGSLDYALSCAVMGMGMAGTARLATTTNDASGNPLYLPLLFAFLPLMLLHLRSEQVRRRDRKWSRRSWAVYGCAFGVLLVSTLIVERYMVRRIPELNAMLVQQIARSSRPTSLGTANRSSILGSWYPHDETRDNEIALVVFAEDTPAEYLRSSAYLTYQGAMWKLHNESKVLQSSETFQGRNVFNLRPGRSPNMEATIYADGRFTNMYFLPMDTHKIATFARQVHHSDVGTIRPEGRSAAGGYGYFEITLESPAPEGKQLDRHLEVPESMRPKLQAIGDRIMAQAGTAEQKINRLRNHFIENYTYELGIQLHTGKDPVIEFLEDHDAGHCEYFASCTTLLLRTQGIPCRYVTGFVCREQGIGGMWVSRRRNAHAWVEAYLPGEGWTIVEATPPAAQRPVPVSTRRQQLRDWFDAQWLRLTRVGQYGGIKAVFVMIWDWIMELPQKLPMWVWFILIGIGMAWIFRDNIAALLRPRKRENLTAEALAVRERLLMAEQMLRPHGLYRPPGQNVATFMRRMDNLPDLPTTVRDEASRLLEYYLAHRFAPGGDAEAEPEPTTDAREDAAV